MQEEESKEQKRLQDHNIVRLEELMVKDMAKPLKERKLCPGL